MKNFKFGDKVRVVDCDELLEQENAALRLLSMFLGIRIDSIEPEMIGVVVEQGEGSQYLVDFGEGFNGTDRTGNAGTCALVTDCFLEFVEQETHNEIEEPDDDYDLVFVIKTKGNEGTVSLTKNGETINATNKLGASDIFMLEMAAQSLLDFYNKSGGSND